MGCTCRTHGREDKCAQIWVEGPERNLRPRCRRQDNTNIDLKEMGWNDAEWIQFLD
jgi:hypothetical protein